MRSTVLFLMHIVCFTETWIGDGVTGSELFQEDYVLNRNDSKCGNANVSKGSGVLVAARSKLGRQRIDCSVWTTILYILIVLNILLYLQWIL